MSGADPIWVALSLTQHIGGKTLRLLSGHFNGDMQSIIRADTETLQRIPGIGPKTSQAIKDVNINHTLRKMFEWQRSGVLIVTRQQAAYPSPLLQIDDEPPTLYVRGLWEASLWDRAIAIVGTRNPSSEEIRQLAYQLGAGLADQGFTIVSGLAAGIDTAAHKGALSVVGARTVAVLGSGVLQVYPSRNITLAETITEHGALVCEVSPDAGVSATGLVARNRIISGLCEAVIVVETGINGGAMYAAKSALEQNRKVYALDIDASGNRHLIENGAIPVRLDSEQFSF